MAITFKIPNRTHEEFGSSLNKLLQILSGLNNCSDNTIVLDFNDARMLNPFFLGGLACAINYYEQHDKSFSLNYSENYNISSYLNTIYFPKSLTPEPGVEYKFIDNLEKYREKTFIPIITFPTGNDKGHSHVRENILSAVSAILKNQLKFSDKNLIPISYLIDEMTHNINDHSQADRGLIFAQYYPSSNYVDLCICDTGIGIYNSYKKSQKFHPRNEEEAIEFAINGRSTKDRPEARGFGISTSRHMLVNGLKGKFFIMSGNTAYIQTIEKKGIINFPDTFFYQGNYVALRIPTIIEASFNIYNYVE